MRRERPSNQAEPPLGTHHFPLIRCSMKAFIDKRRHRHIRVPAPRPTNRKTTWLRGRRRLPHILLMLHAAADQVQRRPVWKGYVLANVAFGGLPFLVGRDWRPSTETFLAWLVHHQIARDLGGGMFVAHPRAQEISRLPNRNRVYLVGKLILEREGEVVTDPPKRGNGRRGK